MDSHKNSDLEKEKMIKGEEYFVAVQKYLDIIDRAHKEVDNVRSVYKWLAGCIAFILASGIAVGGFLTYNSLRDMRTEMRENTNRETEHMKTAVEYMKSKFSQDFSLQFNTLKVGLERNMSDVEKNVNKRIDEEFNKENIQVMVQEKAKEYTEKNVHKYIEQKVGSTIKPISSNLNEQNRILTAQVDALSKRNQMMKLADDAIVKSDADSFRELCKYEGTDLESVASGEVMRVKAMYVAGSRLMDQDMTFIAPDGSKEVGNKMKTSRLMKILKTDTSWENRAKSAMMLRLRHEKGVPDFLLAVCKEDKNLEVIRQALQSFHNITGKMVDVLECNYAEKFWREKKSEIDKTLKPIDSN
jgi:hypothetical protein